MKKIKLIILIVVPVGLLGYLIYYAGELSATYPSIEKYEYSGSINQLFSDFRKYVSTHQNITFKITDTVGSIKYDYAIYADVEMENNHNDIEYTLKFEEFGSGSEHNKTKIELIFAYDKINNKGGYSKEAKGINALIDNFKLGVLNPLKIKIVP